MTRTSSDVGGAGPDSGQRPGSGLSENAVAARILLVILVALVAWGLSIFFFGVPGLYLPALALVPVVWIALLAITVGG
ncbi:MAG: hypothetical protein Q4P24_05920 [Rhodobacterales bacterium]|nr:hypothetical protein [Rhodobacterales bacterium]